MRSRVHTHLCSRAYTMSNTQMAYNSNKYLQTKHIQTNKSGILRMVHTYTNKKIKQPKIDSSMYPSGVLPDTKLHEAKEENKNWKTHSYAHMEWRIATNQNWIVAKPKSM